MTVKTFHPAVFVICITFLFLGLAPSRPAFSQPIPVELVAGSRYASVNGVLSKNLSPHSRFGFFHLNTLTMDYADNSESDLTLQNLLFYEPLEGVRLTGGAFYATQPGFSPTAGLQFLHAGENGFILLAPRVNIESDPSYTVFTILRRTAEVTGSTKLYVSLRALSIFDANSHIKSYQWTRLGLEISSTQFGLAANFDEFGPDPEVEFSIGLFLRRELF